MIAGTEKGRDALTQHARLPLTLAGILFAICLATIWNPPAGRTSWLLEVSPGLLYAGVLAATYRSLPLSHLVYAGVFIHVLILIYGGMYTYAETPLGNWAKETFHFARNHYDRVGHWALGALPVLTIREVLIRKTPLPRGGWLVFLSLSVVLAFAAFWELIEWWVALLTAPGVGQAFLGTQGDVWDTQWDMFLALVGAAVTLLSVSALHDRSMSAVPLVTAPQMRT